MKNELGIEICCDNCITDGNAGYKHCEKCKKQNFANFDANFQACEARIKELQEQQFTWDELNTIKSIIIEVKRVRHPRYCGFHPTQLLSKIERIINEQ